jgi:FkbM family methyltransferase
MQHLKQQLAEVRSRFHTLDSLRRGGAPFTDCALFGAGHRGLCLLRILESAGARVAHFIDNNPVKQAAPLEGRPVLSVASHRSSAPRLPIVIASHAHESIARQLLAEGLTDIHAFPALSFYCMPDIMERHGSELERVYALLSDDASRAAFAAIVKAYQTGDDGCYRIADYAQYFHPRVQPETHDVVIDGGAFDGDTALRFHALRAPLRMVCVEPFEQSFQALAEATRDIPGCTPVRRALWSHAGELRFAAAGMGSTGCAVSKAGELCVQAATIDSLVEELGLARVDLIKLDVEGAELAALGGAQGVIARHRPKLQVCVYHSIEDLWRIALHLAERFPDYGYYLGHHSPDPHETVLYALPAA